MNHPAVSVIICTYNRAQYLPQSLESVLGQTLAPAQVIVVDDGSTDETCRVLDPFRQKIKYVKTENRGKAVALNAAMALVAGDYVWIMDDDDVALSDALSRHVDMLEHRPELGWTYSGYIISRSHPDGRIDPIKDWPLPEFAEEDMLVRLMEECFLVHPTIVVRTACYRSLGPFRPELIRGQDYEMAVRLARQFPCARIAGPTIYRRYHEGLRGSSADQFDSQQVLAKWQEYLKPTFITLRRELALDEYLPKSTAKANERPQDLRRAYLQRAVIMGKKALFDFMLDDVRSAVSCRGDQPSLSQPEREMLRRLAAETSGDPLLAAPTVLRELRSVCAGLTGLQIRVELARVLVWRAAADWLRRHYRQALRELHAALYICGLNGLRAILIGKIGGDPSCAAGSIANDAP
jgi:glycosyltransferase involved in cell wall biosynthesis